MVKCNGGKRAVKVKAYCVKASTRCIKKRASKLIKLIDDIRKSRVIKKKKKKKTPPAPKKKVRKRLMSRFILDDSPRKTPPAPKKKKKVRKRLMSRFILDDSPRKGKKHVPLGLGEGVMKALLKGIGQKVPLPKGREPRPKRRSAAKSAARFREGIRKGLI